MISAKATVFLRGSDVPFVVLESPGEVVAMILTAATARRHGKPGPDDLIELRLGNASEWNGKPLYLRSREIVAVSALMNVDEDDDSK